MVAFKSVSINYYDHSSYHHIHWFVDYFRWLIIHSNYSVHKCTMITLFAITSISLSCILLHLLSMISSDYVIQSLAVLNLRYIRLRFNHNLFEFIRDPCGIHSIIHECMVCVHAFHHITWNHPINIRRICS
eukprot:579101_1